MPTFTAIALESLLEPNTRTSSPKQPFFPSKRPTPHGDRADDVDKDTSNDNIPRSLPAAAPKKSSPTIHYFSPALYATPEPASISSSSPTSVSPSPYVVNRKCRDIRRPASSPSQASNPLDGFYALPKPGQETGVTNFTHGTGEIRSAEPLAEAAGGEANGGGKEQQDMSLLNIQCNGGKLANGRDGLLRKDCLDVDNDGFFDPQDTMSSVSSSNTQDGCRVCKQMPPLKRSEFYDANEDFLSDCSISQSPSYHSNIEADLYTLRVNLFEEIERWKKVEEALGLMRNQWQRIANYLSEVGLSFPLIQDGENMQVEVDMAAHVCQEVVVARFVSEAVEKGVARAEAEDAAEEAIESKNHEIARLRDRLQYYEAMNREMSQRNQEIIELARRQHEKRKVRQRWIWSCIGFSITVGASILAYSYFPHAGKNPLPSSDQCSDPSSGAIESSGRLN